jgi:transposase
MKDAKRPATGRHRPFTPEFRAEAVRLVLSTGRPNHVVAAELGIGSSTLGKWVAAAKEADLLSGPHSDATKELARLRKENEILRQERDLLILLSQKLSQSVAYKGGFGPEPCLLRS